MTWRTTVRSGVLVCVWLVSFVANAVRLGPANYNELTEGKKVFINFMDPNCGYCKKMKDAWEELEQDYADNDEYLVATVDCTVPTIEKWCRDRFHLTGYPSLLYGNPGYDGILLEKYEGKRLYGDMAAFAEKMFAEPVCSEDNLDECTDEMKEKLGIFLDELNDVEATPRHRLAVRPPRDTKSDKRGMQEETTDEGAHYRQREVSDEL